MTAKAAPTEKRDTRRAALDVAARLFRDKGYAAVGLRDIASEMGIKAASLYYHFSSKDEIVIEVLNHGVEAVHREVSRSVAALGKTASAQTVFETAMAAHLRSFLELQDYTSANTRIYGQVPDHVRAATLPHRKSYEGLWTNLLERLARAGAFRPNTDIKLMRQFLIGAMNSTLEWYQPNGEHDAGQIAKALSTTFLFGAASFVGNEAPAANMTFWRAG